MQHKVEIKENTVKELFEKYHYLLKITPDVLRNVCKYFSIDLDFNKNWEENGFDDLDYVEMIMELEKLLDIAIDDDVANTIFQLPPIIFVQIQRDNKLNKLGI